MTDFIVSARAWSAISPVVILWNNMAPTKDTQGLFPVPNGNMVDYYRA